MLGSPACLDCDWVPVAVCDPVAPPSTVAELGHEADRVICPHTPDPFYAIGEFYEKFGQVSDEEVEEMLKDYWKRSAKASQGL